MSLLTLIKEDHLPLVIYGSKCTKHMLLLLFQSVPRRLELSVDLFEEMATIARPPLAVPSPPDGGGSSAGGSKRPLTDETGYIVCLYKVFRGDDGEKFERNWLFWTGKKEMILTLQMSLPTSNTRPSAPSPLRVTRVLGLYALSLSFL